MFVLNLQFYLKGSSAQEELFELLKYIYMGLYANCL